MKVHHHFALLALCSAVLAACGPSDAPETTGDQTSASQAQAESAPLEGLTLTNEDYVGLGDSTVTFHLHWVSGPVGRDPSPGSSTPTLGGVRTVRGASFDRVIIAFDGPHLPGYELVWATEPPSPCPGQTEPPDGDKHLVVRVDPVWTTSTVRPEVARDHENLQGIALTCVRDAELNWYLGLSDSTQVRALELVSPPRLVVDVRHARRSGNNR
jgi:hypothetical protein